MIAIPQRTQFKAHDGSRLALKSMRVSGVLQNAFAVMEVVQTYRNDESTNIEANYTFPLPVVSTLLHLSVRLNDKLLLGRVSEREKAEREYENAVASGDTAVMLEEVNPGLYTMNVGNLMAGEQAEITLRYALPLKWEGDQLRLAIPTTIAPRYSGRRADGLQPHQSPVVDVMADRSYALALKIVGRLGEAEIASPSHDIAARSIEGGLEVGFRQGMARADRDLVLTLRSKVGATSSVATTLDGEQHVAHAALHIPDRQGQQKIAIKILVDCSGSMAGDSIALAKLGALHALQSLQIGDRYSVSAFGTAVDHDPQSKGVLMPGGIQATMNMSSSFVSRLDANLGGTEMQQALEAVFAINKGKEGESVNEGEVLLITDGDTWDRNAIVQACRKSGHRVFVIGIGSSPCEAVVKEIAESTGGAAAFVSPSEDIKPVIERHLQRMRAPRVTKAQLELPGEIVWQSPASLEGCVFPGDTLHVFCGLKGIAAGATRLTLDYADGSTAEVLATVDSASSATMIDEELPRIAAASRIREAPSDIGARRKKELTALAVQHQIITPFTNYLLVHLRGEDAAKTLPELRQVPNMVAAGWGGLGSVIARCEEADVVYSMAPPRVTPSANAAPVMASYSSSTMQSREVWLPKKRTPPPDIRPVRTPTKLASAEFIRALNEAIPSLRPEHYLEVELANTAKLACIPIPLTAEVSDGLEALIASGWAKEEVLTAFWVALLDTPLKTMFNRTQRTGILWAAKQVPVSEELQGWITQAISATTDYSWSWIAVAELPDVPVKNHNEPLEHQQAVAGDDVRT